MRQLLSSGHWPFFSTVASVLRCGIVVGKDFLVVIVDDAAHVRHAAVADFHVVLVEDGCKNHNLYNRPCDFENFSNIHNN